MSVSSQGVWTRPILPEVTVSRLPSNTELNGATHIQDVFTPLPMLAGTMASKFIEEERRAVEDR